MCCCSSADPDMAVTGPRQKTNGFLAAATLWIVEETETASSQPSRGAPGQGDFGGIGGIKSQIEIFLFSCNYPNFTGL